MRPPIDPTVRYTLGVMAQRVSDAVRCAGGLIFDHAAAGWDVTVYTNDDGCSQAIEILGAKSCDLESLLRRDVSYPTVLVVTANLHGGNGRVQACVAAASTIGTADVFFADVGDLDDTARGGAFQYPLGSAASAFKKCAAQAGNVQIDGWGQNENFHRLAARLGAESPAG